MIDSCASDRAKSGACSRPELMIVSEGWVELLSCGKEITARSEVATGWTSSRIPTNEPAILQKWVHSSNLGSNRCTCVRLPSNIQRPWNLHQIKWICFKANLHIQLWTLVLSQAAGLCQHKGNGVFLGVFSSSTLLPVWLYYMPCVCQSDCPL